MSGEHVSKDTTLGDSVPPKDRRLLPLKWWSHSLVLSFMTC